MPDKEKPHAGEGAGHCRNIRRKCDKHTLPYVTPDYNTNFRENAGGFPGLDLDGLTLDEIRRRVRGDKGSGDLPPPTIRQSEAE